MKSLTLLTGTALIGFTVLGVSAAEPTEGQRMERNPFPIDIAEAEARAGARFTALDANSDGKVTREEFDAGHEPGSRGMMGGMGAGHHGMHHRGGMGGGMRGWEPDLDADDPEAAVDEDGRAAMRESFQARMAELDPEIFKRLDADADSKLSAEEFSMAKVHAARQAVMGDKMFARLDRNADGSLTKDEMPDVVARLREMDTDEDGTVTDTEARAYRRAKRTAAD